MPKPPHLSLASLLALTTLLPPTHSTPPTWPSPRTDTLEDLMHLTTGHRSPTFPAPITPCGTSPSGDAGRVLAAEWLRTAFHDAATGNTVLGTGGLDASIAYETRSADNAGPAFNATLAALAPHLSARASTADLLALGVYAAVRACGGPVVQVRAGRVDAGAAGPQGAVPLPQNSVGTFELQFARIGFSVVEMVQVVACGHSMGGVHEAVNPEIVPVGSAAEGVVRFDSTDDAFDNRVVTEYLDGSTANALVVGPATRNGRDSDARVFAVDGNVTVGAMADPEVYASVCADVLQKLIEVVPAGVVLTEPIEVYEVKPSGLQLTLLGGGESIRFTGEVRVRTTQRAAGEIASVKLVYKDRDGASSCGDCSLDTESSGSASGFDDSFEVGLCSRSVLDAPMLMQTHPVLRLLG